VDILKFPTVGIVNSVCAKIAAASINCEVITQGDGNAGSKSAGGL